jgi:hypothetical protein
LTRLDIGTLSILLKAFHDVGSVQCYSRDQNVSQVSRERDSALLKALWGSS